MDIGPFLEFLLGVGQIDDVPFHGLCMDTGGADGINPDAVGRPVDRHALGQGVDGAFGGAVDGVFELA